MKLAPDADYHRRTLSHVLRYQFIYERNGKFMVYNIDPILNGLYQRLDKITILISDSVAGSYIHCPIIIQIS